MADETESLGKTGTGTSKSVSADFIEKARQKFLNARMQQKPVSKSAFSATVSPPESEAPETGPVTKTDVAWVKKYAHLEPTKIISIMTHMDSAKVVESEFMNFQ